MPVMPIVITPGFSLASAASSRAEVIFMSAFTTSMVVLKATWPTGAKSRTGS